MDTLNYKDYHKQLHPIIATLNNTPQLNNPLVVEVLNRVHRDFTQQTSPQNKQETIDQLNYFIDDLWNFLNYPSIATINNYVANYKEYFPILDSLESYPLDSPAKDTEDLFYNGIDTILFWFISILENN